MNTGKLGAYKQLTPPNSDLSGVIVQQEQLNNAHTLKKAQKAEETKKKELAKSFDLASVNTGKQTKYLNFEHALTDAFNRSGGLIEKYANAQERLEKNPSDSEAAGIISNIKRTVSQIATTKDTMLKYNTALSSGIAEGTISKGLNQGYLTGMQRISDGAIEFEIDDYGGVKIMNTGNVDLDGDGIPDEITLESLTDKNNFGIWDKDFDLNTFAGGLDKRYKTYTKETVNPDGDNPYEKRIEKGFNMKNELLLKDDFYQHFGEDVGSLTNAGKSYVLQNGMSLKQVRENPELYKNLVDDTATKYIQTRQEAFLNREDFGARNAKRRLDQQASLRKKSAAGKNSLRTATDGIAARDDRYVKSLINRKLEEQGSNGKDIIIRDAEAVNDELILELSDGNIKTIDLSKEGASTIITALIRPNDAPDRRLEEYRTGTVEGTFTPNKATYSKILMKLFSETMKSDDFITLVKKLRIKGFKDIGGRFYNTIKMPNGEKVDADSEEGMIKIKKYLKENWSSLSKPKEDKKKEVSLSNKSTAL